MDASLKTRLSKLEEEDKKHLSFILLKQCEHKTDESKDFIDKLSIPAAEWLVDYQTDLMERLARKESDD